MAKKTEEFRRDAVSIALTSGLTRPQLASDLDVVVSTLNKWVQQQQHEQAFHRVSKRKCIEVA